MTTKDPMRMCKWKSKLRVWNARLWVSVCPQYGVTDHSVQAQTGLKSAFQEDLPDDVNGTDSKSGRNWKTFR